VTASVDLAAVEVRNGRSVRPDLMSERRKAPFGAQPHGATARRSGADDLCSRSGAFRVFAGCARSADRYSSYHRRHGRTDDPMD
jgi:hypothetical protein